MKKKIYIAGKITGCPDFEERFAESKKRFEDLGYIVLNPAELPGGMTPGDYMRVCVAMIDVVDMAYFMPNYTNSAGALLELNYCNYIGKPVIFNIA